MSSYGANMGPIPNVSPAANAGISALPNAALPNMQPPVISPAMGYTPNMPLSPMHYYPMKPMHHPICAVPSPCVGYSTALLLVLFILLVIVVSSHHH